VRAATAAGDSEPFDPTLMPGTNDGFTPTLCG
jgi:hypothetical protein